MAAENQNRLTPCKAIHAYCIECCGGNTHLVAKCDKEICPLWPYRMGHNPFHRGIGSKKKDPKTGKFLKTQRVLRDDEIVLDGTYKLVRIRHEKDNLR